MTTPPVFERTQSALYYSNDGRLKIERRAGIYPREVIDTVYVIVRDDVEDVLATQKRVLADAYIAGYDLGRDIDNVPAPTGASFEFVQGHRGEQRREYATEDTVG